MVKRILLLITMLPSLAYSWGPTGHRVVGLLAESRLNPHTQQAVQKLLGKETLSDVANWADSLKSTGQYKRAVWYHFEKIPDNLSYLENLAALPQWQQQKGGVVTVILEANRILRDSQATFEEKRDALKFLVHYVGDIHQPFHTGRPEDNGGVKIKVMWFGEESNLHRLWDSSMIYTGHKGFSDHDYAQYLEQKFRNHRVRLKMDVEGWLNESLALREAGYDKIYETDQVKYQALHLPEVDQRIYEAGLRLADMLNDIFANAPIPASEQDLRIKIEEIIGKVERVISLKP